MCYDKNKNLSTTSSSSQKTSVCLSAMQDGWLHVRLCSTCGAFSAAENSSGSGSVARNYSWSAYSRRCRLLTVLFFESE